MTQSEAKDTAGNVYNLPLEKKQAVPCEAKAANDTVDSARLLEAIALLPQPLKTTETLHLASKLVEKAAYDLVKSAPADAVLPLFTIAAQLEQQAKRILSAPPKP